MIDPPRWMVIFKRETDPVEVTPFEREEDAVKFYESAAANWSEVWLVGVVRGPGVRA